jgi:sugar lactone lactonase YvrE
MRVLTDGLGIPESTRWRDGRVWLCHWGAGEVLALTPGGEREVVARLAPDALPFSIDWLPDGRLLVVDGPRRLLLRQEPDGTLATHADLSGLGPQPFNELVVDAAGNAYVNGGSGRVVCVGPDGGVRTIAEGLQWPNGMALIDDDRTLVVADSHARELLAFDPAGGGRRVWAELEHAPDGICADADGAVWVATVPGQRCVRVREGGEVLQTIELDRGCFSCALGGPEGRTLFIVATEWHGPQAMLAGEPTGQVVTVEVAVPHAGHR